MKKSEMYKHCICLMADSYNEGDISSDDLADAMEELTWARDTAKRAEAAEEQGKCEGGVG